VKLIILDRDGVINYDSEQFIKSPEEWRPIPGSLEAIARLNHAGFRVVVATNHSEFGAPGTLQAISELTARDCLIVDPWNCFGAAQVFAYASEVAALRA